MAGTTVDPVDELVEVGGTVYRFIDTAGIRRRVKEASGHEYYAILRTASAIERAEVCVVVIDAAETIAEQDLRVLTIGRGGRSGAGHRLQQVGSDRCRAPALPEPRDRAGHLVQFSWAPSVNISALTGRARRPAEQGHRGSLEGWETRISTGKLNAFLGRISAAHPHPVRGGKQPGSCSAPRLRPVRRRSSLFTSGQIEAGYVRFIKRRLREEFGFAGTPVHIEVRAREKRGKKRRPRGR